MSFTITIKRQDDSYAFLPPGVKFEVENYSSTVMGGPELATISATGNSDGIWNLAPLVGYKIFIYEPKGELVWWGYLSEVRINFGRFGAGVSLDSMANRVRLAYSYTGADGVARRGTTPWTQDLTSISYYGKKELLYSVSNLDLLAATERRNDLLQELSLPQPKITDGRSRSSFGATLICRGDADLLDWEYCPEPRGLEQAVTNGSTLVPIGYAIDSTFSWVGEGEEWELWTNNAVLETVQSGMKFDVTGGTNDGDTYTLSSAVRGDIQATFANTTFTADDNIVDGDRVVGKWGNGDVIQVESTSSNNGYYRIDKVIDKEEIDVLPATISNETTTALITRGYYVTLNEQPTTAYGDSTVLTLQSNMLAQSFTLSEFTSPWTCNTISIRVQKVGSPSDNMKIELRGGSDTAPSGSVLVSATIAGSSMYSNQPLWYQWDMGNTQSMTHGTRYWIVASRTGTADHENYYAIAVDEDAPYTGGVLRLGSIDGSWYERTPNATMPFIVRGSEDIVTQITNIVDDHAQFVSGVDFLSTSTIEIPQYRIGDTTSRHEIEKMLDLGVNSGRRLLYRMTPERRLVIYEKPVNTGNNHLFIDEEGILKSRFGSNRLRGQLPVGEFADIKNIRLASNTLAPLGPYFIWRAEYDVKSGDTRVEPLNSDPFNTGVTNG